jgi:hypothetical protein
MILSAVLAASVGWMTPSLAVGEHINSEVHETVRGSSQPLVKFDLSSVSVVESVSGEKAVVSTTTETSGQRDTGSGVFDLSSGHVFDHTSKDVTAGLFNSIVYNPLFFGDLPGSLSKGQAWEVTIPTWTLGPGGSQKVSVDSMDPSTGTLVLSISGSGMGPNESQIEHPESLQAKQHTGSEEVVAQIIPGQSKWTGTARFEHGILTELSISVTARETIAASKLAPELTQEVVTNFTQVVTI